MPSLTDTTTQQQRMQSAALVLVQLTSIATRHLPEVCSWQIASFCDYRIEGQMATEPDAVYNPDAERFEGDPATQVARLSEWATHINAHVEHMPSRTGGRTRIEATGFVDGVRVSIWDTVTTAAEETN